MMNGFSEGIYSLNEQGDIQNPQQNMSQITKPRLVDLCTVT